MNLGFVKRGALTSVFVLFFSFLTVSAQETEKKLATGDQRRIIAVLLNEKFKNSPEETIYLSTVNLPAEILENFPLVRNKTIRFIAPEKAANSGVCAYEFGKFEFIDKFVSVTFGNCRDGLAYDFVREGGKWKPVGLIVIRELTY